MESFKDDKLAATLSALRPAPRPAFAAELDERVAAGFPRRSPSRVPPLARLIAHVREIPPRRALFSACATAITMIVIATVVVAATNSGSQSGSSQEVVATLHEASPSGSNVLGYLNKFPKGAPSSSSSSDAESSGGEESAAAAPNFESEASTKASEGGASNSGAYAAGANHRDVERSAEMVLGADPAEVSDDAAKVFAAVHAASGIILNSSVHDGSGESAPGANFELLIPSAKLGDALGAFSQIAEVRYRREATNDITAPTVGVSERLQDSNAKVESLLAQLAAAESDGEREAVEAELGTERRHAASLRSQLTALQRRANFSRVSLQIKTGDSPIPSESSGGGWSIGDALHDAGHILAIAAGVAIIALAILGPLALIAALIWLANRAWVRRGRQRALGLRGSYEPLKSETPV
jgi:hypothetical protein